MKTFRPFLILLALAGPAMVPASAAKPVTPPTPALSAPDRALADQAARYLSGLKTAEARFVQTDPRGAVTKGVFHLQRPGKARFAYDAPTDLTVVADGTNVNVYDGRLKTFDQYPLSRTPLSLLLASEVKFDKAVSVVAVSRVGAGFAVTLKDARKAAEGRLTLSFSTGPVALTGWTVVDGQGLRTQVRLQGLKTGGGADPGLFMLKNPGVKPFKIKP